MVSQPKQSRATRTHTLIKECLPRSASDSGVDAPSTTVQRWSVGTLVTGETTICSFHRKTFFLLEHESGRWYMSKRAPQCYTTLRNFTAPDDVPARRFFPIQMFALSLQLPFIRRLKRRGHRGRANLTLSSPRHCNNTAIVD